MKKFKLIGLIVGGAILVFGGNAKAEVTEEMVGLYYQVAEGDARKTDEVFDSFEHLVQQEGATGLSMVMLGASETLVGRDAFMPWDKMKYVEQGIAKIDKGLALLDANSEDQTRIMGLPAQHLAIANAAAVLTELPEMFNQQDKGYELYVRLIDEMSLEAYPWQATQWIFESALNAAKSIGDEKRHAEWALKVDALQAAAL